ncbi:FAD-dependent oxidoreductase [Deinococcus roseus]|uniref:FAD/NAD(P)-binding domain-containing protein n=1 Tax=Deinococcus roseus TaxID=392414 RepID=A0ABQ2D1M5_9DEIO|nr:FAD-dependent oxidoreductase [Deinococcus roseus]GGJ42074.1 hypothetical protein GCM10008938_30150 [Deinococcus roseus]
MSTHTPRSFPHTGHVYDVAVVGAGLAGSELAHHLAQKGLDVLLVTQSLDSVGNLFHPTVDTTFPASSLMQLSLEKSLPDRSLWVFHRNVKQTLELAPGIHLLQSCVTALHKAEVFHLSTWEGPERLARKVVLAVGSFLDAQLTIGNITEESGRLSEIAYSFLHQDLLGQGFEFSTATQQAPETGEAVPYSVRFQALKQTELEGFQLKRIPDLYALGRCTEGEHTYQSVVQDALRLAEVLS